MYKLNKIKQLSYQLILSFALCPAMALTYTLDDKSDVIGEMQSTRVLLDQSLADIGRRFDIGIFEMIEANPKLSPKNPRRGALVTIPSQFVIPVGLRKDLVINLAEMRMYYFHPNKKQVTTYPIGIGRKDWETPLGSGTIIQKVKNPSWTPPQSIRDYYDEHNMYLPEVVPPGPKNPLGDYAMRLSIPGYLIHGTNRPSGIGLRTSSGCIRMYPEDIEELYNLVPIGTKVRIINKPYKVGRHNGRVYIEAHRPLSGEMYKALTPEQMLEQAFIEANVDIMNIDFKEALKATQMNLGYPQLIELEVD
jgi:L,D-transpeptidase ErfK/SrfK